LGVNENFEGTSPHRYEHPGFAVFDAFEMLENVWRK
jgi:hypothetical protein